MLRIAMWAWFLYTLVLGLLELVADIESGSWPAPMAALHRLLAISVCVCRIAVALWLLLCVQRLTRIGDQIHRLCGSRSSAMDYLASGRSGILLPALVLIPSGLLVMFGVFCLTEETVKRSFALFALMDGGMAILAALAVNDLRCFLRRIASCAPESGDGRKASSSRWPLALFRLLPWVVGLGVLSRIVGDGLIAYSPVEQLGGSLSKDGSSSWTFAVYCADVFLRWCKTSGFYIVAFVMGWEWAQMNRRWLTAMPGWPQRWYASTKLAWTSLLLFLIPGIAFTGYGLWQVIGTAFGYPVTYWSSSFGIYIGAIGTGVSYIALSMVKLGTGRLRFAFRIQGDCGERIDRDMLIVVIIAAVSALADIFIGYSLGRQCASSVAESILPTLMVRTLPVFWLVLVGWDIDRIGRSLTTIQHLPSPPLGLNRPRESVDRIRDPLPPPP